ncbi:hypothetical protein BC830DRAFT_1085487 [Chytriomyces sp. MP71]|nr:hypothetical protein BC830DRAFT_1085487 [Chytriomyces sp. MP71]
MDDVLPSYAEATLEWPREVFFARSTYDAKFVELLDTGDANHCAPIAMIDGFHAENAAPNPTKREPYVGASTGAHVEDLRLGVDLLSHLTLKAPAPHAFLQYSTTAAILPQYVIQVAPGSCLVSTMFELAGTGFRWIPAKPTNRVRNPFRPLSSRASVDSHPSSPSPTSSTANSEVYSEYVLQWRKSQISLWTTVATARVSREMFYAEPEADSGQAFSRKCKLAQRNPHFAHIAFDSDKLTWKSIDHSQFVHLIATLWSMWLVDVLNPVGRLAVSEKRDLDLLNLLFS